MIDLNTYKEILAGCLQLHAERLFQLSRSHFEPDGPQARAQIAKAKELINWSHTEISEANVIRDFAMQKISIEEITLATNFAEEELDRLDFLMIRKLEEIMGPLGKATIEHNERCDIIVSDDLDSILQRKVQTNIALLHLKVSLNFFS